MAAQALDQAYFDLSYKGFETIKSGMGQLKSWAKDTSENFDKMASKATGAFASLSGTIIATSRSASPQVFDLFTGSLKALSIVVGASLAPILVQFTGYIVSAIKWWSDLDSGTKANIASFMKWGTIITGGIIALNTLNGVFGGFAKACISFAISNPLAAALIVVVGVVALLTAKMDELNNKTLENIKNVDRLKNGDVNKDDMKKSWVGKDLQAIADPAERAKAAQKIIDIETKRMNDAAARTTNQGAFSLGLSRIGQGLGINTETAELDKTQQDAGRNIGIATTIRDLAKQGKSLDVKDVPKSDANNPFSSLLSANLGQSMKNVSVGGISDVWKNIQSASQEDPSLKLLRDLGIMQKTQNELTAGIRDELQKQNAGMPAIGGS